MKPNQHLMQSLQQEPVPPLVYVNAWAVVFLERFSRLSLAILMNSRASWKAQPVQP